MKASEVVVKLQELIKEHGDLEVTVFEPDKLEDGELSETIAHIAISCDDADKPVGFTFCDEETAESFIEVSDDD